MEYTVKALADLAGVTPRTLRWYDRIGLLKPLRTTEAGYRLYGPAQLDRLQDILFYRELGLDLASIRTILDDPAFDRQAALQSHLAELEARRARLDDLILTVQRTINDIKGGTKMTDQEKFEAFKRRTVEANETAFGQEIREKYGDEEMDRANACVLALTQEEYAQWKSLGGEIHTALVTAVKAGADPAGPEGQRIAALHRRWLSYSWESYTPQAHVVLAELSDSHLRVLRFWLDFWRKHRQTLLGASNDDTLLAGHVHTGAIDEGENTAGRTGGKKVIPNDNTTHILRMESVHILFGVDRR